MATQHKERNSFGASPSVTETAKDTAGKAGEVVKDTANKAGDLAKDAAGKASELAKDFAGRAGEIVKDTASTVADKTSEAASYVGHKADDATVAAGSNIKSFADTVRQKGPQGGILGAADAMVADTLESCGKEMEQGLSGMAEDLTKTIRKHPIPAVLIGMGVGFLLARTLTK